MKVIVDYDNKSGEMYSTHNGVFLANIGSNCDLEQYSETRKLKEYVTMVKDLKESGFTADEIIELIGKGY